jgi:GGDEF domain-containing protein
MNGLDIADIIGAEGLELTVSIGIACSTEWAADGKAAAEAVIDTAHERAFAARESGGNAVRYTS